MFTNRVSGVWFVAGACWASLGVLASCAGTQEASRPSGTGAEVVGEQSDIPGVNTVRYDRGMWQQLLTDHQAIRRTVLYTPTGVEATTESDDPAVAARIKEHTAAMQARMKAGAQVRVWDGVFADLFAGHGSVRLALAPTSAGVKISESSDDPQVVALLWSHAAGLSDFVREGHTAGAQATPRIKVGAMPPPEVAIGGVKHRFLKGQPEAAQLAELHAGGVGTLVNFRKPAEQPGFDEAGAAASAGLGYVNLPYAGASELTDGVLDAARAVLRAADTKGETVSLHCRTGNRVGAVWVAYRVLDGGVPAERAMQEGRAVGMVDPALEARVREYTLHEKGAGATR